ncbi:MAG: metallophosphoesterase family protein [Longimicrobiales bacterium]
MTLTSEARLVGLISDTHGKLRPQVFSIFDGVDAIVHAGDIGDTDILDALRTIAPVHAVHGNTDDFDIRAVAPESVAVELGGRRIMVVHGHMVGALNPRNLRAKFPACDVIVYGHTHVPFIDDTAVPLVVNPGAAGPARFNLKPSVAILDLTTMKVTPHPMD